MRRKEWLLVAVIYVCATVTGFAILAATKIGDLGLAGIVGALVAIQTAGWFYHRRNDEASPIGFRLLVGAALACLWLATALAIQRLWPVTPAAEVTIVLGLIGSALMPLLLMGAVRKSFRNVAISDGGDATGRAVLVTCVAAVFVAAAAVAWMTVAKRNDPPLAAREFPGFEIALPQWAATSEVSSSLYERGRVRLDDPDGNGRFITVGWEDTSPGADMLGPLFAGMGAEISPSEQVVVAGHGGQRLYILESGGTGKRRAAITHWSCDQDGRWISVMTFTNQAESEMAATHERMLRSVRCHTEGARKPSERVLPEFTPPPDSKLLAELSGDPAGGIGWVTPADELIIFSRASPGRIELLDDTVSSDMIGKLLRGLQIIDRVDRTSTARWVGDVYGHRRRTWTVAGAFADGTAVQGEVMVWFCDVRNYSFMGFHFSPAAVTRDPGVAVGQLLTARCHTSKK